MNLFAQFSISYKKIEYLLSEYIESLNNKCEKVSDYLDGLCFEDEVKYIINMENPNIINLPNLYYILKPEEISYCEFDYACLLKENEILNLNKSMFDRVVNLHNLKFLQNDINIKGLSLIFFEIKSSQHSIEKIIKKLIEKVNFLYPLLTIYLNKYYSINIENCVLYFGQIFDSKFKSKSFAIPDINKILFSINNLRIKNKCKILFIHGETNIGQFNIRKLNIEIKRQNEEINFLKKALIKNQEEIENNINQILLKKQNEMQNQIKKELENQIKKELEKQKQEILNLRQMIKTK